MKAVLSSILMTAALLSGCSPTSPGISDQPVPDSRIYVAVGAQVNTPSNTGRASYTAYCVLQYADTGKSNTEFNSAKVTVNGAALARVYSDGYFQSIGSVLQLEEGDSLQFVIKHQKVGTIKGVVFVPPSVPGVTVTPGLSTANLPNSETTFNLRWTPVTTTYYLVEAAGYNYWQTILIADSTFTTQADSATVILKDTLGSACPWVYFRVQSINFVTIPGFATGSGFGVTGAYYRTNSNMPNVSSNMHIMRHLGR